MRKFSLTFKSIELEKRYHQFTLHDDLELFLQNQAILTLISLFGALYSFGMRQYFVGLGLCGTTSVLAGLYQVVKCNPKLLELSVCINLIAILIMQPVLFTLNVTQGLFYDIDTFLVGQGYTFLFLSYNRYSQFHHKAIAIVLNSIIQLVIKLVILRQFSISTTVWALGTIMLVKSFYRTDKLRREAFLARLNEVQWQRHLEHMGDVGIISCTFNAANVQLVMKYCNQVARKKQELNDQPAFLALLRSMRTVIHDPEHSVPANTLCRHQFGTRTKTLESMLFMQFQQDDIYRVQYYLGYHKQVLYLVQLFSTWEDDDLTYHILIKENQYQFTQEQLKSEYAETIAIHASFRKQLHRSLHAMQMNKVVQARELFKLYRMEQNVFVYLSSNFKAFKRAIGSVKDVLHVQFHAIRRLRVRSEPFTLFAAMRDAVALAKSTILTKQHIGFQYFFNLTMVVHQDRSTLFMILLNLLQPLMQRLPPPAVVKVRVKCVALRPGVNIIKIQFVCDSVIANLQVPISNQLQDTMDFQVAEYLLYQIGPFKHLNLRGKGSTCSIAFAIYQDLQQKS